METKAIKDGYNTSLQEKGDVLNTVPSHTHHLIKKKQVLFSEQPCNETTCEHSQSLLVILGPFESSW